jgi:chromosome segregation protein
MKFSRLRLLGFKSFVEPGEFVIERGLTGVVGPNGCGKSNLVEALRWVMGESSYKNMRASGMDDVIFSGSGTRPARNTAEVTLFLDNSSRTAPAAFNDADELQVSRRIEREAGSVYRINGKEARAKDVQLLFADQSTGARSPSCALACDQRRCRSVASALRISAERLLKRDACRDWRFRLSIWLSNWPTTSSSRSRFCSAPFSRSSASWRRVCRPEMPAASSKSARRACGLAWISSPIRPCPTMEGEARSALAVATALVGDRAAMQMAAAKEQGIGAHHLPELRDAEAAAAAAFQRLSIARTQIEEEAGRINQRQAELGRRLQQLDADIVREERMVADNADILERLASEEASLNAENAGATEREANTRAAFEQAAATLELSEAKLAALTAERAEAAASRTQIERSLRETAERRDRFARQLAEVDRELSDISSRIAGLADPAEKQILVEQAEAVLEETEAAAENAEQAVTDARAAEAAARTPVQDAKAELAGIETEARTLARMLNAASGDLFPAVLEKVSVERGFETALGAALGEDLDAPLDRSAPVHWGEGTVQPGDPALPAGVRSLADVVSAPAQLARRLAQVGIVGQDEGRRLQAQLAPGQRLVSREGALWRWDGFTASADAPTAAALRLAQKNRLAELDAEAVEATRKLRGAEEALMRAETALRLAGEAERDARQGWRDAQHALDAARNALAQAEKAAGELSSRRAALDEARARVVDSHEEAAAAVVEAETLLQDAADLGELQARLEQAAGHVSRERAALADARAVHEGLKREADARARRLDAIGAERRNWLARAENASAQIASLGERKAEAEAEREKLADAPEEIDARRRALLSQIAEAETLRKAAGDRLQEAENHQAQFDKAAIAAIQGLAEAREARARAEERLTAADERRAEVEARIQETLNTPPHLVIRHTGLEADSPLPDMADVERQLERLKIERERLGAVNLRAEEEQKELSEKLEAIVSEREDIIEAIRKLRQAIQSLNREGRERLLAAYDVVNGHFQRLFSHLFGGGTAELQLIESEDPLEAGLEILARPPGKKPQTMTLLSGGEQALTAMSLIFAVFLTNPAPICVLDEVDAPLDDQNVERFCNLMDEMAASTETRFVVITHNPITMARMNRLFGVTMAEQGVSQLVSVDLQAAEAMREAS